MMKWQMVRIKNSNGSFCTLTWHKVPEGIKVSNDYYGTDGYYNAGKSFTVITTQEAHDKEIDAARALGLEVSIY